VENMQTKTFTDIDIVNRAGMYDYHLTIPDSEEDLLILGNRGYPHYYRIEILFLEVEYLACAFDIDDTYIWRIASPEETKAIHRAFSWQDSSDPDIHCIVYCLEEGSHLPLKRREARKFFIAARGVEITISYDANNPSHVASLGLGEQDEQA
jgi:hypothetical protein